MLELVESGSVTSSDFTDLILQSMIQGMSLSSLLLERMMTSLLGVVDRERRLEGCALHTELLRLLARELPI